MSKLPDWPLGYCKHEDGRLTVVTPPKEERMRMLKENEFPINIRKICTLEPGHYLPAEIAEEYARLFSAAPALLAACRALAHEASHASHALECCGRGNSAAVLNVKIAAATKAISLAEGATP